MSKLGVRAIVDVPYSHGTLAVNREVPEALLGGPA
jgi:hypothetical protein